MDDARALRTLDIHFSMLLGCPPADLRRPGWSIVTPRADFDPMALLFGQRTLLSLIAPTLHPAGTSPEGTPSLNADRAGVAVVAAELRQPVTALLRTLPPQELFTPAGLGALDALLAPALPERSAASIPAHGAVCYTTAHRFVPYVGQWQEWIEPLEEAREIDPMALGLLARYSGGVYVIRQGGAIVSFAGFRALSPHVAELGVRTNAVALRGHGLGRALAARATRAILASDRLPLLRYSVGDAPSHQIAQALGYRAYADSAIYMAPTV